MRLLTHNMLQCNVKKCIRGYPLHLEQVEYQAQDIEFNKEFLERIVPKLDWSAFQTTLKEHLAWTPHIQTPPILLSEDGQNDNGDQTIDNAQLIPYDLDNEEWWKVFHEYLLNRKIIHAKMTCTSCNHVFPIKDGIPNMLVREDENIS
jgi:multifunctional methyltransferase subunit TRM112